MFPIIVTSLDLTDNKHASSDRFVAVGEGEIVYIISNIFAKPQVFYYLVSDAKIFDIIYQLSPLLECDSRGDKLSGHTPTRVIIV
jgi:hypothetical protein